MLAELFAAMHYARGKAEERDAGGTRGRVQHACGA